jgi:hypothetical protein
MNTSARRSMWIGSSCRNDEWRGFGPELRLRRASRFSLHLPLIPSALDPGALHWLLRRLVLGRNEFLEAFAPRLHLIAESAHPELKMGSATLDAELLRSIATQTMSGTRVVIGGKTLRVSRTSASRLRTAAFEMSGRECQAIEQNPDKPSRWGRLARAGHLVVQFKDVATNRFAAVAVDGDVKEYGKLGKRRRAERP